MATSFWPAERPAQLPLEPGSRLPIGGESVAGLLSGGPLLLPSLEAESLIEPARILRAEGFRSAAYIPLQDHPGGPIVIELASRGSLKYEDGTAISDGTAAPGSALHASAVASDSTTLTEQLHRALDDVIDLQTAAERCM